jgi:hypothetical protein
MTSRLLPYVLAVAGLALQGCVLARQEVTPLGRAVKVTPIPREHAPERSGELFAVSAESLWLARDAEIVSVPWSRVERVQVRRSTLSAGRAMAYSVVLGLLTGGALDAACSQVEAASCGGVLPVALAGWLLVGGLSAISIESSATQTLRAARWEELRRYARFPQGLPDGLPRRTRLPLAPPGP